MSPLSASHLPSWFWLFLKNADPKRFSKMDTTTPITRALRRDSAVGSEGPWNEALHAKPFLRLILEMAAADLVLCSHRCCPSHLILWPVLMADEQPVSKSDLWCPAQENWCGQDLSDHPNTHIRIGSATDWGSNSWTHSSFSWWLLCPSCGRSFYLCGLLKE